MTEHATSSTSRQRGFQSFKSMSDSTNRWLQLWRTDDPDVIEVTIFDESTDEDVNMAMRLWRGDAETIRDQLIEWLGYPEFDPNEEARRSCGY